MISAILRIFAQGDRYVSRVFDPTSVNEALGDVSLDIQGCFNVEIANEERFSWACCCPPRCAFSYAFNISLGSCPEKRY